MQVKKKPKKTAKAVPEKSRKKKQPGEGQIKKQPFLKRMLFGEEKPDLSELEAGSTTILDILSPTTVDTKSRDYIIVDDVYHAYLYITGYLAVKKEIAAYQEKCDYLIKSSSQSPAVMERWVLKVQALEEKKRHYEGVLQRELDGLDDEFSVLKLLSQELQVRARSIRSQRFQQRVA